MGISTIPISDMTAQFILRHSCKSTEGTAQVLSYAVPDDGVLRSNVPTPFLWNELVEGLHKHKEKKSN